MSGNLQRVGSIHGNAQKSGIQIAEVRVLVLVGPDPAISIVRSFLFIILIISEQSSSASDFVFR